MEFAGLSSPPATRQGEPCRVRNNRARARRAASFLRGPRLFTWAVAVLLALGLTPAAAQTSFALSTSSWADLGPAPMSLAVQGGSMMYVEQPTQPPIGSVGMTLEPIVGAIPLGADPITGGAIEVWGLAAGGSAIVQPLSAATTIPFSIPSGFSPHSGVITLNVPPATGSGFAIAMISADPRRWRRRKDCRRRIK
jgi:hypothetical protein